MSRKKLQKEELINTHVINIQEIREAEREEKYMKNKKKPVLFLFLGILLISFGVLYPKVSTYFSHEESVVVASKNERYNKDSLTCISNFDDTTNNVKIYTKTIYKFDTTNSLTSATSNTEISLLKTENLAYINGLKDKYLNIYKSNDAIKYDIKVESNTLYINTDIIDIEKIYFTQYNSEINTYTHTKMFKKGDSMSKIKKDLEELGNLCN